MKSAALKPSLSLSFCRVVSMKEQAGNFLPFNHLLIYLSRFSSPDVVYASCSAVLGQ